MDKHFDKERFKETVRDNVRNLFRKTLKEATQQQLFQAVAYAVKDVIIDNWMATQQVMDENPESILRQVVDENDGHVSGQSAFIAARRGDPIGQHVCDDYIDYLCAGIVNLVNIFQPDTLAIGGGVSNEQDEQLLFPVRRIVARQSIPCEPERRTRIVKAELGSAAGIIGAALLGKKKRI